MPSRLKTLFDIIFRQWMKNFFFAIGNSAKKAYDSTLGKWFGKAEKAADDASDLKPKNTPDAGEQPKA